MSNSVPASNRFHTAVEEGAKQRALIYFFDDNLYLTNDDLMSSGLHYENFFNLEEDITIGNTPSATLSFSVFNENHRLDNMSFGRFKASVAALVNTKSHRRVGNVSVEYDGDVLSGHRDYPYFRSNGEDAGDQPDFPIESIIVREGFVYCIGSAGQVIVYKKNVYLSKGSWGTVSRYSWSNISELTWGEVLNLVVQGGAYEESSDASITEIMIPAIIRYAEKNIGIVVVDDQIIEDYLPNGLAETYEYVDLGVFYANRPERVKTNIISVDGYDAMAKFDVSTENMKIAFPITLKSLLDIVCSFVGIRHKVSSFINEDITIDENSDIFQSSTARDVIGYIAEAACSVARIDYDGLLDFSWWSESNLVIDESGYSSFVPNEYVVKPIDRLQIRSTENDIGILVGNGTNGYVIQENPFLIFSNHDEGILRANQIYNRLSSFPSYAPGSVKWFADWSYRPGDIITVMSEGVAYRYPIFGYTLDWSGMANATLESTGNEYREVMDAQHRESFAAGRKMLEIEKTIDGVKLTATEAKTESGVAYKKASELEQTVDGFGTRVSKVETSQGQTSEKVSELEQTVDGFGTRVSSVEGNQGKLESAISQNATNINAKVSKGSIISEINLSTESAKIKAPKIEFDGAVITNGTLQTGNWTFDSNGSKYLNGSIKVNMTVLNGNFVGGGTYNRAFYGSSNCDVQYGADYGYNTFIRSKAITLVAHNNGDMQDYRMATFSKYPGEKGYQDFTFYCNESESQESPSGNIGYDAKPWDTIYVREILRREESTYSSRYVKHNIENLPEMGTLLDQLRPVSFKYNGKSDRTHYGLIVEDTAKVLPTICNIPDAEEGSEEYKNGASISYTDLIAPILKEIQSLRARVKALEERM